MFDMAATHNVDAAVRSTEDWIDDLVQRLSWRDRDRVHLGLLAGLHTLRDVARLGCNIHSVMPSRPKHQHWDGAVG